MGSLQQVVVLTLERRPQKPTILTPRPCCCCWELCPPWQCGCAHFRDTGRPQGTILSLVNCHIQSSPACNLQVTLAEVSAFEHLPSLLSTSVLPCHCWGWGSLCLRSGAPTCLLRAAPTHLHLPSFLAFAWLFPLYFETWPVFFPSSPLQLEDSLPSLGRVLILLLSLSHLHSFLSPLNLPVPLLWGHNSQGFYR